MLMVAETLYKERNMAYKKTTNLIIRELRLMTTIGFYPAEKKAKQPVVINIEFEIDDAKAAKSDDVKNSVNYAEIAGEITKKVPNQKFNLLEALGDFVAEIVMKHKLIKRAVIEINKPKAPLPKTKGSAVRIICER